MSVDQRWCKVSRHIPLVSYITVSSSWYCVYWSSCTIIHCIGNIKWYCTRPVQLQLINMSTSLVYTILPRDIYFFQATSPPASTRDTNGLYYSTRLTTFTAFVYCLQINFIPSCFALIMFPSAYLYKGIFVFDRIYLPPIIYNIVSLPSGPC